MRQVSSPLVPKVFFGLVSASIILLCTLTACGGGGTETKPVDAPTPTPIQPLANVPPSVNAGEDQIANENVSVTLTGVATDSDGSITSYSWVQKEGTNVTRNIINLTD